MSYYDMAGQPITYEKWAEIGIKHVGDDRQGDVHVSTVHLGVDHNWGEGPPLIFETMIFGGEHSDYQERYATREEAEAGHARALALAFGVVA